jgi:hypothetical protein
MIKTEQDEKKLQEQIELLLKDPLIVKEIQQMREKGRSDTYIQNWLRGMAQLHL